MTHHRRATDARPVAELVSLGWLSEINRIVAEPRGLAIGWDFSEDLLTIGRFRVVAFADGPPVDPMQEVERMAAFEEHCAAVLAAGALTGGHPNVRGPDPYQDQNSLG